MSLIICPECGHENQDDARYCDMCGIELPLPCATESPSAGEGEESQGGEMESAEQPLEGEEVIPVSQDESAEQPSEEEEVIPVSQDESAEQPSEEEEVIPVSQDESAEQPLEEEEVVPIAQGEDETPVVAESAEEETSQISSPEELPEEAEPATPEIPVPVSTPTVLDFEEPVFEPVVPPTSLEMIQGILTHVDTGIRFELPQGESMIYIGKLNDEMPIQVDLSDLPDADIISRVHAVIHVEDETFYLEDAGSLNGTAVNGETVKPGARFRKQLNSGDTITLGRNRKVNLIFEIEK